MAFVFLGTLNPFNMLSAIKYITIIISAIVMILAAALGISSDGIPSAILVILFYTGILMLLYQSSNKNYKPGLWIAFTLAMLPVIGVAILLSFIGRMGC